MSDKLKILYFGFYDPNYARNSVLISGLRQNGVEVIECRDNSSGVRKFINKPRQKRSNQL